MIRRLLTSKEVYIPPQGDLVAEADAALLKRRVVSKVIDATLEACDVLTKEAASMKADKQIKVHEAAKPLFTSLDD